MFLERSFSDFVLTQVLQKDQMMLNKLLSQYLKYMGIVSRQILDLMKDELNIDFDPYIVSS